EKIRDKKYGLVFMDHMMPEMDGIETTARIREWEAQETVEPNDGMSFGMAESHRNPRKRVPIIALSANAVTGAGELFLESGMDDFLYKPIAQGELNRLLGKWLPKDRITIRAAEELPGVMENRPAPACGLVINRAAGLANAVGNERFYQQLLSEFKAGHGGDIRKIRTALDALDYRAAYRLAHTLKSVANVIGAGKLGAAALTVEKALRKTDRLPPREMLETLEREFEAVMAELASIAPESPPKTYSTGELDMARALAFTRKLEPLLVTRNAGSLRLREDIREILGPADEMCGTLINQIENYDFAEAVDTLNKIKEKMVN
ncbi:MAG: Hpt domain-containing protein, partial [Treponema sp.]|nr:Hpt domain-containing protein [Treponema sp.]